MNNRLRFYRRGKLLTELVLDRTPIDVGSDEACDVRLRDAELAPSHWVIAPRHGSVVVHDVGGSRPTKGWILPLNSRVSLGREHAVERVQCPRVARAEPATDPLLPAEASGTLSLVIGRGSDARRVSLGARPLHVGSGAWNDVVIHDRTVSARHCRIVPMETGLIITDLSSRNGTYVDGVRVLRALVGAGANLRLGRTPMRVVARRQADASSAGVVTVSPAMTEVLDEARRCGALSWPVLLLGESGVGKEVVARVLHEQSPRRHRPFVALNAGGLPSQLVESELFGHERGSFTGAASLHRGVFEQAHGGTLFLDEIGELPLAMQARLLRVLETWEVRRVGSEVALPVDVRLICATHRDLRAMAHAGGFRDDLYYRLARLVVEVPPLRERPEDIETLATHFLAQAVLDLGPRRLTSEAVSQLLAYPWPGNVRELRNVVTAAAVASGGCIDATDIELALLRVGGSHGHVRRGVSPEHLRKAVDAHRGNLAAAARHLGMPRSTLRDRLRAASRTQDSL